MDWAQEQHNVISSAQVDNLSPQFPDAVDFSIQLYTTLAQMTDGEA